MSASRNGLGASTFLLGAEPAAPFSEGSQMCKGAVIYDHIDGTFYKKRCYRATKHLDVCEPAELDVEYDLVGQRNPYDTTAGDQVHSFGLM